ncbi:extracellular solute-binding protein [Cohnella silvisoli]|uniref:Extracellular solute-binding protein n=1 Tax=Cohnella silvisoli TaxID=2873699 RepID=A0ABV1KLL6_9BACL|nr:extracellular solute-binding protein [Cohnella silvisoli]MCD9020799.1 extracellular solute-binding protein [Cohnella silvisoli]
MRFKSSRLLILLFSSLIILSGCLNSKPEKPIVLKVSAPSVQQFYRDYGYGFEKKYPHIQVQVVPYDSKSVDPYQDADIRYMYNLPLLRQQIEQGQLLSLSSRFQKEENSELGKLSPIVTTLLKSAADNGEMYGVSPTFQGVALFYNKDLFKQYGIAPPANGAAWKDIFALAMRFPNKGTDGQPLYGIGTNYYRNITLNCILEAGRTEGLSYIQPQTLKVTMNTEKWRTIWNYAIEAFRSGAIKGEEESLGGNDPSFMTGQVAMTLGGFSSAYSFEEYAEMFKVKRINWGIITPPVDPGQPDRSRSYTVDEIFGISTASMHQEEAWKLLEFIVSDAENIRNRANYRSQGIPSITEYMQPLSNWDDLSPIYKLQANPDNPNPYLVIDPKIVTALQDVAQPILDQVIRGDKTVEAALAEVELKGQQAVDVKRMELQKGALPK